MTNVINDIPATRSPADPPLTPGQALANLFVDNADRGANAANDALVAELLKRMRAIQSLAANPNQ